MYGTSDSVVYVHQSVKLTVFPMAREGKTYQSRERKFLHAKMIKIMLQILGRISYKLDSGSVLPGRKIWRLGETTSSWYIRVTISEIKTHVEGVYGLLNDRLLGTVPELVSIVAGIGSNANSIERDKSYSSESRFLHPPFLYLQVMVDR